MPGRAAPFLISLLCAAAALAATGAPAPPARLEGEAFGGRVELVALGLAPEAATAALAEALDAVRTAEAGVDPALEERARDFAAWSARAVAPWELAVGQAADGAVAALRARGAASGLVRVKEVWRGFGPGPDGRGWRVELPPFLGLDEPLAPVWLRDRALAVARRPAAEGSEEAQLEEGAPQGALAALAVSDLGIDAQGVAVTMLRSGTRDGQFRLGALKPPPSVLWVLGRGAGPPALFDHRWSLVPTR